MSPTAVSTPGLVPSTCADGPWPDGPCIGSATLFAFCITVTN